MAVPRLMFGADPFGPRFNIVILRGSHLSGYNLGRAGPLRHLVWGVQPWSGWTVIEKLQTHICVITIVAAQNGQTGSAYWNGPSWRQIQKGFKEGSDDTSMSNNQQGV